MMAATTADNHPSLDYEGIRVRLWEFMDLLEQKPKTEAKEGE